MLVYEYKCNGRNMVPNGLSILDEEAIVMILSMSKPSIKTSSLFGTLLI